MQCLTSKAILLRPKSRTWAMMAKQANLIVSKRCPRGRNGIVTTLRIAFQRWKQLLASFLLRIRDLSVTTGPKNRDLPSSMGCCNRTASAEQFWLSKLQGSNNNPQVTGPLTMGQAQRMQPSKFRLVQLAEKAGNVQKIRKKCLRALSQGQIKCTRTLYTHAHTLALRSNSCPPPHPRLSPRAPHHLTAPSSPHLCPTPSPTPTCLPARQNPLTNRNSARERNVVDASVLLITNLHLAQSGCDCLRGLPTAVIGPKSQSYVSAF